MNYQQDVSKAKFAEDKVILDFTNAKVLDISGVDAIQKTREYLIGEEKKVLLRGVPQDVEQRCSLGHEFENLSPLARCETMLQCRLGARPDCCIRPLEDILRHLFKRY
jgi:MFS superfamily sulfate permease-like transporter